MSPPQQLRQQTSNCSSLLIYRPPKDERLSWPSWLTYSGWLTHISGHPSATSPAQDSESTSAKDQCSTAGPRHQLDVLDVSDAGRDLLVLERPPPVEAHRPAVTYLQFPIQVCFPCNDHVHSAAEGAHIKRPLPWSPTTF